MKEKILPFIMGLLVGTIIATAGFLIYSKSVSNNGNMPMNQNGNMGQPPEKPDGDNNFEPPTAKEESNS